MSSPLSQDHGESGSPWHALQLVLVWLSSIDLALCKKYSHGVKFNVCFPLCTISKFPLDGVVSRGGVGQQHSGIVRVPRAIGVGCAKESIQTKHKVPANSLHKLVDFIPLLRSHGEVRPLDWNSSKAFNATVCSYVHSYGVCS